ncbi:MAG: hypothetical protein JW904_10865 [Spirochaetales bacterium]|nr:hypothetical protein [Spirochaetales bacterium]
MTWNIIFFIIGIATAVVGIWNLAQRRNIFLAIAGILWFVITLFKFILPQVGLYNFVLFPNTTLGDLLLFMVVPGLIILAYFQGHRRS